MPSMAAGPLTRKRRGDANRQLSDVDAPHLIDVEVLSVLGGDGKLAGAGHEADVRVVSQAH
jgi:hypothetical protein